MEAHFDIPLLQEIYGQNKEILNLLKRKRCDDERTNTPSTSNQPIIETAYDKQYCLSCRNLYLIDPDLLKIATHHAETCKQCISGMKTDYSKYVCPSCSTKDLKNRSIHSCKGNKDRLLNVTAPKGLPHLKLTATVPRVPKMGCLALEQLVAATQIVAEEAGRDNREPADSEATVSELR